MLQRANEDKIRRKIEEERRREEVARMQAEVCLVCSSSVHLHFFS